MNNYIQIYKNVIDPKYCDELIKKFENNSQQYDKQTSFPMSFTQINLNQHNEWKQDVKGLVQVYLKYLKQ